MQLRHRGCRNVGDSFKVSISPEEGYGVRDIEMVQSVPRSAFEGVDEIVPGGPKSLQPADAPGGQA